MGAAYGFSNIIGIDFSKKLCDVAASVCIGIETKYPDISISIECMDARLYCIPETVGILFLFNPFDAAEKKDRRDISSQNLNFLSGFHQ